MKPVSWQFVSKHYKIAFKKVPARVRTEVDYFIDANQNLIATYPDLPDYVWSGKEWFEVDE